jgi:hypothetical protein
MYEYCVFTIFLITPTFHAESGCERVENKGRELKQMNCRVLMLPILLKLWMFYKLKRFNILLGYSSRGTAVSVRVGGQLGSKKWRNILHLFGLSNRYTNIGISFIAVACCHI